MRTNALADGKEAALRLLARREYGANELKQRLLQKGYESEIANQVIELLSSLDLQSDERYTASYVRRRSAKGYGPLHITCELLKNGINKKLIENEISLYVHEWISIIRKISSQKFNTDGYLQDLKQKSKQIRFFQSRGFDLCQISEALK